MGPTEAELVPLDERAAQLLVEAREAHVVLDFVLTRAPAALDPEAAHRSALGAGIREASRRRGLVDEPSSLEGATALEVGRAEFFGSRYDLEGGRILMAASPEILIARRSAGASTPVPGGSGPYTWSDQDDIDHVVWIGRDEPYEWGVAQAFAQPPRPLRLRHIQVQRLFNAIMAEVAGGPASDAKILRWDVHGVEAAYFWPSQDFGGATAWTVSRPDDTILVIAHSADEVTPFGPTLPPGVDRSQALEAVAKVRDESAPLDPSWPSSVSRDLADFLTDVVNEAADDE